jgi:hypothetical protein
MVGRSLGGAALTILLAMCGCGGSSGDAGTASASCGFVAPVPKAPKAASYNASIEVQAESQGLQALDGFLGPYLRGDIAVYRGTLSAHDNQSVLASASNDGSPGYKSQTVPEGPAVASLAIAGGSATLSVHSTTEHKYLVFQQDTKNASNTTNVGIILPDGSGGGNTGTCIGCVPDLGGKPQTIAFENIVSTQVVNISAFAGEELEGGPDNDDVTLHTYGSASLTLVPPCGVTFDDLAELNASSGLTFALQGDQRVSQVTGYGYVPGDYCQVTYTIELYVSTTNLADYGVQNFQQLPPQEDCSGGVAP